VPADDNAIQPAPFENTDYAEKSIARADPGASGAGD
jgi:hypothetical protein